jgi:hypothetical protein
LNNEVEEDEMGGACNKNRGEEEPVWVGGKETTRKTKT